MAITPETVRRLTALRLTRAQFAEVMTLLAEAHEEADRAELARRERQRERKRRSREGRVTVTGLSRDGHGDQSPPKERSPEPPKETTPPSSLRSVLIDARETPRSEMERVLDAARAAAVIDHRQRLRKPLTAHAARLLAGKFAKVADPNAAADAMIANGWQGFEPEWLDGRTVAGNGSRAPPSPPRKSLARLALEANGLDRDDDRSSQQPDFLGETLEHKAAPR